MSCGTVRIRRDGRSIGRPSRSRPPCPASSPPETPATVRSSGSPPRSEEHTSELQSRLHLVCRLLLEKKKKTCEHPDVQVAELPAIHHCLSPSHRLEHLPCLRDPTSLYGRGPGVTPAPAAHFVSDCAS